MKPLQVVKLVVLSDAAALPPLNTLTLHTLQVAVLLSSISRLKYLQTNNILVKPTADVIYSLTYRLKFLQVHDKM